MKKDKTLAVQRGLLKWYHQNKRDLPWRKTRDPYAITISEVMLQQTQVDRVIPKYTAWLKHWPTWNALARATSRDMLRQWSGLGYNRRALALKKLAEEVVKRGTLPRQRAALEALPGIGPYTAGAIMSFAWRKPVTFVDTNIRRVVGRVMFGTKPVAEKKIAQVAMSLIPSHRPDLWHHALMDLGATVCTARRPKCEVCPLNSVCRSYPSILVDSVIQRTKPRQSFKDTDRFWRGRIVATLAVRRTMSCLSLQEYLQRFGSIPEDRFGKLLKRLKNEGMVKEKLGTLSV